MSQEEFLLKWNDHHASFFTIVEDLCRSELLCDVTLACGGQVFETHKLMLCVCSPYFRALLTARPDKHPIVYLKDVNPKHLEQLLSYMYRGEINVLQDDLGPLIETARGLQIKGLADAGGSDKSSRSTSSKENKTSSNGETRPSQTPSTKRSRTSTPTPTPTKTPRLADNNVSDKSFRIGQVTVEPPTPTVAQYQQEEEEVEDDDGIVEVDPRDGNVKQELWIANTGEEEEDDYDIPNEQYEQELQAEDEQYIQAGAETQGQQFNFKSRQGRILNYDPQCLVSAYWDVLNKGMKVTASAFKHQVPRKTLEYYVKGKATAESYQKIGLPMPNEIYQDSARMQLENSSMMAGHYTSTSQMF